ncbi:MAG TPA: HAD hydrolase-like protein [Gaiellaceae bacterium]|nr:HAD hydrolase-like protein [Gaiellaceae bacterium]
MALTVVVIDVVGDRVDNDVVPALAAGLQPIRIRRGAHADVESPAGAITIGSLDELPKAMAHA